VRWTAAALVAWAVLAHGACAPTPIEDRRRDLLTSWGDSVIVAGYRELEVRAAALDGAVRAWCATPSAAGLAAAREAWWQARAPWKRAEVFAFGPYRADPDRLGPRIDFWPARPDAVAAVLAGEGPVDAATLGAPARGLPALELLLWMDGDPAGRRCAYLGALSADLEASARRLREAWDPAAGNYVGQLTEAGRGSADYPSLQRALSEIVNRMGFTVENIRADKLGRPLGAGSGGVAQPDKAESIPSGRSLEDVRDSLRGIERLFYGDPAAAAPGLTDYLDWRGRPMARRMRARLDAAYAALDAIPGPLTSAVMTSPAAVQAAMDRLGELQRLIQVDILGALSLTVAFNDNDGD